MILFDFLDSMIKDYEFIDVPIVFQMALGGGA